MMLSTQKSYKDLMIFPLPSFNDIPLSEERVCAPISGMYIDLMYCK